MVGLETGCGCNTIFQSITMVTAGKCDHHELRALPVCTHCSDDARPDSHVQDSSDDDQTDDCPTVENFDPQSTFGNTNRSFVKNIPLPSRPCPYLERLLSQRLEARYHTPSPLDHFFISRRTLDI